MCWDCYANPGGDPYKNFKRGGVEVEDFDDEVKYRHPKRRTKKGRPRSVRGREARLGLGRLRVYVL
jgi:hypothetical protein